jgi:CRP-like cAMP-binding protein
MVRIRAGQSPSGEANPKPPPANHLLAALPAADYARLSTRLARIALDTRTIVQAPGAQVEHVYFPLDGFFSELAVLANGEMIEVATIGREGMVGISAETGMPIPLAAMVQSERLTCYRLSARNFRKEMDEGGSFSRLLRRYSQARAGAIVQSAACNAVHTLEQRLARWLLMAHDRVGKTEFPLTQEFAAMMLGAARPTVSVVAGALQKAGPITYHRGRVRILNRKDLEAASCECYATATKLFRSVFN